MNLLGKQQSGTCINLLVLLMHLDSEVVVSDVLCVVHTQTCLYCNVVVLTIYLQYSHRLQGRMANKLVPLFLVFHRERERERGHIQGTALLRSNNINFSLYCKITQPVSACLIYCCALHCDVPPPTNPNPRSLPVPTAAARILA